MTEPRRIRVRGLAIATTDVGSGVPVVMMHGVPDDRCGWDRVIAELGGTVRVLAPDFPGFGASDPLPDDADLSPAAMANLWGAWIDEALEPHARVVLVVHDFGGPWMLPWMLENRSRVRGLVVLNTLFHSDFRWHYAARIWQRRGLGELSMRVLFRGFFASEMRRLSPGIDAAAIDHMYGTMHASMRKTTLRVYRAFADPARAFGGWETRLAAARDTVPTRVVWGDADSNIPSATAERYGANVRHLPDHGHFLHLTAPGIVADAIRELV